MDDPNYEGWTLESLKKYVEMRFADQDTAVQAALAAAEKFNNAALASADRAITKAEAASESKFAGVNEFRALINDMLARLMTRSEAEASHVAMRAESEAAHVAIGERIDGHSERIRGLELQAKDSMTLVSFQNYVMRQEAKELESRRWKSNMLMGIGLAIMAAVVSIVLALTTN